MTKNKISPPAASVASQDAYRVPALERGIAVLKLFSASTRELTGADISRALGLPRASVFRLIHTLEQLDLLEHSPNDPSGAHFRLGVGVLRLGFEYLASQNIAQHASPILDCLRDVTGMTAHLVVRDGRDVVFVLTAMGPSAMFQTIPVGTRLPVHATALGRALLCKMDDVSLCGLFEGHEFKTYTSQTPRNLTEMKDKLRFDVQQGYSLSEGGFESSISVVAAPVQDQTGNSVAAVSITVPAHQIEPQKRHQYIQLVRQAAQDLTHRLSHLPLTK